MPDLTLLGSKVSSPTKKLETFGTPPCVREVTLVSDEVTSLCPVTGQPDFSTVTISYTPRYHCLESKSLKLYFWTFREQGLFCEAFASTVLLDVVEAVEPLSARVVVEQNPRGGIALMASASYVREEEHIQ